MIRPFDWRDLGLLNRVLKQGLCLHPSMGCTRGPNTVLKALREIFPTGRSACTLVFRPRDKEQRAGVGQINHGAGDHLARLAFVGPAEILSNPGGALLLDALVEAAGARSAHHLLAEVNEDSEAFEALRSASFAIYARQRIWKATAFRARLQPRHADSWRRMRNGDLAAVQGLYQVLVPPLVQQIEPGPLRERECLVHWDQDELTAYAQVMRGPLGTWIQPFFHPSVKDAETLFSRVLRRFRIDRHRPLYLSVRSYQGWMNGMLERFGFEPWQDQAVMVKHLVAKVRKRVLVPLRSLEGTRPEPTSPIMRSEDRRSVNRVRENT